MSELDTHEIHRALGRIEGKQDALLATQTLLQEENKLIRIDQAELRQDLNKVRFRLNWYSGAVALGGAILVFFKDQVVGVFFP